MTASAINVAERLAELGLELPQPAAPVAAYVPAVESAGCLHISGQLPFRGSDVITGRVGDDMDDASGYEAARRCALMVIAQINRALDGDWSRFDRVVKLGVFVTSATDFTAQPKVANGASELMEAVFGDAGRHARSAVGVAALPLGAAVEVDAIIAVHPAR